MGVDDQTTGAVGVRGARDEIARLQASNRDAPDSHIELRLIESRREASSLAPPAPAEPPSWWSTVADPWPTTVNEPPEIGPGELDAATLRAAILHHGCLMVRGLIPQGHVDRLCHDIDETLAAFDRCVAIGPSATEPPWFVPFDPPGADVAIGRALTRRFAGGVNVADSPRTFFDLVEALGEAGLPELLAEYLGGDTCVAIDKCTVRRVPPEAPTGWHQDSYRFPQGAPVADVWIALSECGIEAPGLEIVPRRVDEVAALDPDAAIPWVVPPGTVERMAGDAPLLSPAFGPGDAIIFDEMLLHRTGTFPGMSKPRYGADAWFFPAGSYLAEKVPTLLF